MNSRSFRRIVALCTLTVASAFSLVARADAPPPAQPVFLNGPADGATVSYPDDFSWANTSADKYILKFTINETGQKLKINVTDADCGLAADCEIAFDQTPLSDAVKDGQTVKWRVIAKYGTVKVKSAQRTLTANTVQAPDDLYPAQNSLLEDDDSLIWESNPVNQTYTLIVKHAGTGQRVVKHVLLYTACGWLCGVNPYTVTELQPVTAYNWFIKAKGLNGNKAKSPTRTFVTPIGLVAP